MVRKLFPVLALIFFSGSLRAQSTKQELSVGDTLPNLLLSGMLSDTAATFQFSDLHKGKYLIIDFWTTYCSPCVQGLITSDSILKANEEVLAIVAVSPERAITVNRLFNRKPRLRNLAFPILTNDSLLHGLFPHTSVPHLVWIDPSGKIIAITFHDDLTANNLEKFLGGKSFEFPLKKENMEFNYFHYLKAKDSAIGYRSTLARWSPGDSPTGSLIDPINFEADLHFKHQRYFAHGVSIIYLYMTAAFNGLFQMNNFTRVELNVEDSSKIVPPLWARVAAQKAGYKTDRSWMEKNLYFYELILPRRMSDSTLFKYMLEDLNRSLPYVGQIIYKRRSAWVIVNNTEKSKRLRSAGGKAEWIFPRFGYLQRMQNQPMNDLLILLNWFSPCEMFIDETVNKSPIDLELGFTCSDGNIDINLLRQKLNEAGFDLRRMYRNVPVLFIRDKRGTEE